MKLIIVNLLFILLSACSTYGNHFDCPIPKNGIKCQSISNIADKVQKEQEDILQNKMVQIPKRECC